MTMEPSLNVLGHPLDTCSCDPNTGWYRDGKCNTDENDRGSHTVCCVVTKEFLEFTRTLGGIVTESATPTKMTVVRIRCVAL